MSLYNTGLVSLQLFILEKQRSPVLHKLALDREQASHLPPQNQPQFGDKFQSLGQKQMWYFHEFCSSYGAAGKRVDQDSLCFLPKHEADVSLFNTDFHDQSEASEGQAGPDAADTL